MPSGIGATPSVFGRQSKSIFVFIALLIVAGAALIGSTGWKAFLGNVFPVPTGPVAEFALTPALAPSSGTIIAVTAFETDGSAQEVVPLYTNTPTFMLIPVNASTLQPEETVTPLPQLHKFEVTKIPPGGEQAYLVHIVAVGETLDKIAGHYNTTVQAIMAVNYKLKPPVWVQYPLVIPLDTKDPTGLPAFKVYVVEAYESISAKSLADVLDVDASALEFYNLCTSNCQFNKGDVLLLPCTQ